MAQDWYYIRDGQEKSGPVSPSHLKSLAASGELRPTDLVWTDGMTDWKPADRIESLFATAIPVPVAVPVKAQPPSPPSSPPGAVTVEPVLTVAPAKPGETVWVRFVQWFRGASMAKKIGVSLAAFYSVVIVIGLIGNAVKPRRNEANTDATPTTSTKEPNANDAKRETIPSLAQGRLPADRFIQYVKQRENLTVHGEPSDVAGTPLSFFNNTAGEPCRVHIGDRKKYGQNVSAFIVETIQTKQVAAVVLGTPYDLGAPRGWGNEMTSIISFVEAVLPEANLREMMGTQTLKISTGGTATATHGKARVEMTYDDGNKELRVEIFVSRE